MAAYQKINQENLKDNKMALFSLFISFNVILFYICEEREEGHVDTIKGYFNECLSESNLGCDPGIDVAG